MKKNKEGYYIIIKWSIQKEDFTLINIYASNIEVGFPSGSAGKESVSNVGDVGLIPGSGRYPEEGNGYPLQYSCPENPMDRGAWQATVHRVTKSWTLSKWACMHTSLKEQFWNSKYRVSPMYNFSFFFFLPLQIVFL